LGLIPDWFSAFSAWGGNSGAGTPRWGNKHGAREDTTPFGWFLNSECIVTLVSLVSKYKIFFSGTCISSMRTAAEWPSDSKTWISLLNGTTGSAKAVL